MALEEDGFGARLLAIFQTGQPAVDMRLLLLEVSARPAYHLAQTHLCQRAAYLRVAWMITPVDARVRRLVQVLQPGS